MRKIPTLYLRNPDDRRLVLPGQVTPGCEWVFDARRASPTVKWDGTCTYLDPSGTWWARREVRPGKTPPDGWEHVETDAVTGKAVGWVPAAASAFARWHAEAVQVDSPTGPGTYELVGPKINGNPHGFPRHRLLLHGQVVLGWYASPEELIAGCVLNGWEGIVWWHQRDDRKAKLKVRDLPWTSGIG